MKRRGGAAKTALSLSLLGLGSALFGALVVGPNLGRHLAAESDQPTAPVRMAESRPPVHEVRAARPEPESGNSEPEVKPTEHASTPAPATTAVPPSGVEPDDTPSVRVHGAGEPKKSDEGAAPPAVTGAEEPDGGQLTPSGSEEATKPPTPKSEPAPKAEEKPATSKALAPKGEEPPVGSREHTVKAEEPHVRRGHRKETTSEADEPRSTARREHTVKGAEPDADTPRKRAARVPADSDKTEGRKPARSEAAKPSAETAERVRTSTKHPEPTERTARKEVRTKAETSAREETPPGRHPRRLAKANDAGPAAEETVRKPDAKPASEKTSPRREEPAAASGTDQDQTVFLVQVGRFKSREDARKLRDEIADSTHTVGFLVSSPQGYRVQVGAYRDRTRAEQLASELRARQYRVKVSEGKRPVTTEADAKPE